MIHHSIECPQVPNITALAANAVDNHYPDTISQSYNIQLITPLFGGGVASGVTDPITLIRPTSIRGHLRFWWRATRGVACQTVNALQQREGEIWGTTDNPSPVSITVNASAWNKKRLASKYFNFDQYGPEAYVLFPAKQDERDIIMEGFSCEIILRWFNQDKLQRLRDQDNEKRKKAELPPLPPLQDISLDIEAAMWAWVNFGGVGARTRRGCGAIFCQDLAPSSQDAIPTWFSQARQRYELCKPDAAVNWSVIDSAPRLHAKLQAPLQAWNAVIEPFKAFRQGQNLGRNTGSSKVKPGRSRWPEADSLRRITGRGDPAHMDSITLRDNARTPAFPRAEFGLPINFQFKGNKADEANQCELYPLDKTRMASPLILRPLGIGDGKQAVAMMLPLKTQAPQELALKNLVCTTPPSLKRENIQRKELADYSDSPMGAVGADKVARSANGSAMEAFLSYAKAKGFKEIDS
ncbi:MAG: type III-B CRISPR module RAMP protein Cmr1 [Gammaproteobacteria bacterium]|nr:type III-B CRISPR module RAMP protein Cmr1 [Gammaproteobacteria bacterium]